MRTVRIVQIDVKIHRKQRKSTSRVSLHLDVSSSLNLVTIDEARKNEWLEQQPVKSEARWEILQNRLLNFYRLHAETTFPAGMETAVAVTERSRVGVARDRGKQGEAGAILWRLWR